MSDTEEEVVKTGLYVGGAYAVYLVAIKPLLAYFGASPEQAASINNVDVAIPADNPFNGQYQPFIDGFAAANPNSDLNDYLILIKGIYDDNGGIPNVGPTDGLTNLGFEANCAEAVYGSFKWYKLAADFSTIMTVFDTVNSKVQVAAIAAYLQVNYGKDLWTFLKNGAPGSFRGMHASDLAVIADRVNSLPVIN